MPRIRHLALSLDFFKLAEASIAAGEKADCFPFATAAASGIPYPEVLQAFADAGRKRCQASYLHVGRKAFEILGLTHHEWHSIAIKSIISTYPGVHKKLKNVTTRHPVRFAKAWEPYRDRRLIFMNYKHACGFRYGIVQDVSRNKVMQVNFIWEITGGYR